MSANFCNCFYKLYDVHYYHCWFEWCDLPVPSKTFRVSLFHHTTILPNLWIDSLIPLKPVTNLELEWSSWRKSESLSPWSRCSTSMLLPPADTVMGLIFFPLQYNHCRPSSPKFSHFIRFQHACLIHLWRTHILKQAIGTIGVQAHAECIMLILLKWCTLHKQCKNPSG